MDKSVLYLISYGLYVVGVNDGERPCGCVINSAFQITSEPMTLAISLNKNNYTHTLVEKAGHFSLSIISEETAPALIGDFGYATSREKDKFANYPYKMLEGMPILTEKIAGNILCRVLTSVDRGTHTVFFAEIIDTLKGDGEPMTYSYYHKVIKGKAPKNAPTYQAPEEQPASEVRYRCTVCGYIYEGELNNEPDDWTCPVCGQPKSVFVRI
ncbi:MAG: flavin reductase [Clostridia bacterium]|nr:flavin reductase [Clostridia bacterium]